MTVKTGEVDGAELRDRFRRREPPARLGWSSHADPVLEAVTNRIGQITWQYEGAMRAV